MKADWLDAFARRLDELRALLTDSCGPGGATPPDDRRAAAVAALAALRGQGEELLSEYAAQEAAARHCRALVESAPDGLLLTDAAGVVREANPAAARLLDAGLGGPAGRLLGEFIAPEDQAAFCDELDRAVRGEPARERVLRLRAAGALALTSAPARDAAGGDLGVVWGLRAAARSAGPLPAGTLQDTWLDAGSHSPARVLVVDDEDLVRSLSCNVLRAEGYEVVEAADGRAAVDVFRQARGGIDLVLLDWVMPHLSGGETLNQLRQIDPAVPVIVVSGYMPGQRETPEGVRAVIDKPFSLQQLVDKVGAVLAGRTAGP
jgi:CheY-like chemotaxis protein/PAS domain-containing protein